jgi:hypothetical protein
LRFACLIPVCWLDFGILGTVPVPEIRFARRQSIVGFVPLAHL